MAWLEESPNYTELANRDWLPYSTKGLSHNNTIFILVSIISLYKLNFPEQLNADVYKYEVKQIIHCIGTIILIVSFIGLLLRIIDFVALLLEKRANLTPDQSDNQLIIFFKDFFKVILVIVGIMMVLKFAFGAPPHSPQQPASFERSCG